MRCFAVLVAVLSTFILVLAIGTKDRGLFPNGLLPFLALVPREGLSPPAPSFVTVFDLLSARRADAGDIRERRSSCPFPLAAIRKQAKEHLGTLRADLEAVRALIAKDPSLARAHYDYRKPLYFAVRENRVDVARRLLS